MMLSAGYASLGSDRIYYQVLGSGPIDLVVNTGGWGSIDLEWDDPGIRLFFEKLAGFSRVIRFDGRGSGASDPVSAGALPPWESFVEELESVMDAVGSERAAIVAHADGGPVGMLIAANRPDRVGSLVLVNTFARFLADDDFTFGFPVAEVEEYVDRIGENWGASDLTARWVPSRADDPKFKEWIAKVERSVYSPAAAEAYGRAFIGVDARHLLPAIRVPTLVLHVAANPMIPVEHGRFLAEHIEGATLVEIPGADGFPYWENPDLYTGSIEEFLTGNRPTSIPDRRLATVLFTDIVQSTERAGKLGDQSWRNLLDIHDETTRRIIEQESGQVIKSTGDGTLAIFDGPGHAVHAALDLQTELAKAQIELRVGIHAGEIDLRGDEISGIAVHLAARVVAEAHPGEILVSRTVSDLLIGSNIILSHRGAHTLKGIEGTWDLYAVNGPNANQPTRT